MDFNPRSREGSDIVSVLFSLGICISIHAPVKGATATLQVPAAFLTFQSTLPHPVNISIHAPVKGATICSGAFPIGNWWIGISIHAPVKGATDIENRIFKITNISIHAPVKGATFTSARFPRVDQNFNPRSREGSDSNPRLSRWFCCHFNPRSREGSDFAIVGSNAPLFGFQSTLP